MTGLTLADVAYLGAASFTPASVADLALWLDAADTATVTASGSPARVSQWSDKSGAGRDLTQAVAASQPTTGATTINGRNVLDFTGGRRVARLADNIAQAVGGLTIFSVVQGTYSGSPLFVFVSANNSTGTTRAGTFGNAGQVGALGRRNDGDAVQTVNGGAAVNGTAYVAGAVFDYSAATLQVRRNGVGTNRPGGFQTAGVTSNTTSRIAIGGADGSLPFTGAIAEVLIYRRALTAAECGQVERYLNTKWQVY